MKLLARGDQVVYVPRRVIGQAETIRDVMEHPATAYGFVTSVQEKNLIAYVRYWSKGTPMTLRTRSNSEGSPLHLLYPYISVPQSVVTSMLETLP